MSEHTRQSARIEYLSFQISEKATFPLSIFLFSVSNMLAHRIIPCLDVEKGRVVKGVNFVGLRDAGDPVDVAARYEADGADELVFLDITASSDDRAITLDMVRQVAERCFMPFTVGGGIRTVADAERLIQAGAEKVSINTAAVVRPEVVGEIAARFGRCATVVNIDPKRVPVEAFEARRVAREAQGLFAPPVTPLADEPGMAFEVHTHGGRKPTGLDAVAYAHEVERLGAGELIVTSMDADGVKTGYDLGITSTIAHAVGVPVVASGGCGNAQHMIDAIHAGADAVLAASIFHFGEVPIPQAKAEIAAAGLPVRC